MTDLRKKPFELFRKVQHLRLEERLNLPPKSEVFTLQTVREINRLSPAEGASVTHIADLLAVSVPTVSRCLQKLVQKGYVVKITNEKDRRGAYVRLTDEGEALARECSQKTSDLMERALSHVAPDELEQFFSTFDKIYDAIVAEMPEKAGADTPDLHHDQR